MLAPALAADPSLRIATKAGYVTAATGGDAVNAGVLTEDQAVVGHSLAPQYVRWQMGRSREQLGRERLDLVLLHNPERAHPGDRLALHRAMREAFVVLEEAVAAGHVGGSGRGDVLLACSVGTRRLRQITPHVAASITFARYWSKRSAL